ncbi:hypothetical protein BJV77DRAFT_1159616 [Russula vinacea]|nr:hypothetical protein BJV77DRAFT_1159616 [Russula vinacea]
MKYLTEGQISPCNLAQALTGSISFPPGRGSAKGRNDLVEKPVLEDGLELPVTISVWRESVSKNVSETGRGGRGAGAGSSADDGAAPGASLSLLQLPYDADSNIGQTSRSQAHLNRKVGGPAPSSTPRATQPTTPQKSQRRPPPTSPSVPGGPKGTEYTASSSVSDGASTKVAFANQIESVLAPSLLHLLSILEELGVRVACGGSEHMTALVHMREQMRDRKVKEEALKKGVTAVEWAILFDKLQSL